MLVLCSIATDGGFAEVQAVADTNDPALRPANPRQIEEVRFGDRVFLVVAGFGDAGVTAVGPGAQTDVLTGMMASDERVGLAGDDTLRGRGGTDSVVFRDGFGGDTIRDADAQAWIIDLARVSAVPDLAGLTIVQVSGNGAVTIGADPIAPEGAARADLSAVDFAFRREGAGGPKGRGGGRAPPPGPVTGRS